MRKLSMYLLVVISFAWSIYVLFMGLLGAAVQDSSQIISLFSIPFAMVLVMVSFWIIPKQASFERYSKGLESIFLALMLILTILQIGLILYLMDTGFPVIMLVPIGVGLVLIATANTLPRFQLELPPTSSEPKKSTHQSWNKGLRPFSKPLIIGGLAMLLCAFLPQHLILIGFLTVLACTLVTSVFLTLRT
ncbi:hypothetical protein AB685_16725 [Bacillus sp. LL01]|uniref:hypothetical protein n=1 Tax=Bacillus sp. LL01 TaxID=1665556 RepID=UPI00064D462B|nr:hypothetical protein [Bacillus sp. LL01]KMJ57639.1 hypothetical protein AB685_16725 [Bacillus sp. LL01]